MCIDVIDKKIIEQQSVISKTNVKRKEGDGRWETERMQKIQR
jgi:hypothetical protein